MPKLKDIDLIGKMIVIENSSDLNKIGLNGLVVYETKNIVVVKHNEKFKCIKKAEILKIKEE
ncbi:MAG TPA: ribonuclease P protein subunit [archaeon]|nr:ribonuclease P protein subunit [archaeon]